TLVAPGARAAIGRARLWIALLLAMCPSLAHAAPPQAGGIRGQVRDADFDVPLPAAQVLLVETGRTATTDEQGLFSLVDIAPGSYTLVVSKAGFTRQMRTGVAVLAGRLTDVDVALAGEFTELDEFVVQDVLMGGGSEAALLALRFDSPALVDSISSDLMSRAGASDAASALRLVAGASLQDGKSAVIRGLPDRYVSSQLNGVKLPSADAEKRAVELDQYPAAVIESIQVTKTFTPDQQGDASGGAVDLRLKGIPTEQVLSFDVQYSGNSSVFGRDDFLTYEGGGVGAFGLEDGSRDMQLDKLGQSWDGAVGVSTDDAPQDYKLALTAGDRVELEDFAFGGSATLFYERDSSYYDDGQSNSYWIANPGQPLTPEQIQFDGPDNFKTALFDVTQGVQSVQWGGLGTLGIENDEHRIGLTFLYTHVAEDKATLAEDTRGKEYYFPGYDPNDPTGPGNQPGQTSIAPYIRLETLEYTERTTSSLQLRGDHALPHESLGLGWLPVSGAPQLDWLFALSSASLDQPDKRQFGSFWVADSFTPGVPPFIPPGTDPATHFPFKPAASFNLGNLQRTWKEIDEDSTQLAANVELPFEQWSDEEGELRLGAFLDQVDRTFDQESFSNIGDAGASFDAPFETLWSGVFPGEDHPILASEQDVDYDGEFDVAAWYAMLELPLDERWSLTGGLRFESTSIGVVNDAEDLATWFPPGSPVPVDLTPGAADVDFQQDDVLPSVALRFDVDERWTLRASYSGTVARQTFRELTPILQEEFLGGPIFIGNPDLRMSSLDNFDLRADYVPYEGGLVSLSLFHKEIEDAIENVQQVTTFTYTTAVNYPEGRLSGVELELRQDLGRYWERIAGLTGGFNATLIESEVELPAADAAAFANPSIGVPITSRDMTDAPEYLLNFFLTYELPEYGAQFGAFYTVQGDTLVAGAGQSGGNFVPDVYATEFGTLNLSYTQRLAAGVRLAVQVKNLLDPEIQEVFRAPFAGPDVVRTSYTRGIELAIGFKLAL
ncbi:MAG TPA: TonB-dependent receptor, partial [Planctomycetota bacterium]|nr:TonB-dependent receptor [Planctomycetota bacterium]